MGNVDKIDTSGMGCPQPVLMTKKAIEKSPNAVDIIVDNNTAKENVKRFLEYSEYRISVKEEEDKFLIEARK